MFKSIILSFILLLGIIDCLNLCGDWTQYKDKKCFKILDTVVKEEEAQDMCSKLGSNLLTVNDQEEKKFIIKMLTQVHLPNNRVWTDLRYGDRPYHWKENGKVINYWFNNDHDNCAQMTIASNDQGSWRLASCDSTALVICEKKQELSLEVVRYLIEEQQKLNDKQAQIIDEQGQKIEEQLKLNDEQGQKIEEQQKLNNKQAQTIGEQAKKIEEQAQLFSDFANDMNSWTEFVEKEVIPIGFIYTQLPNQSSPEELWHNMEWLDVTQNYSGLFFRAEGAGSEQFGLVQQANQSRISDIKIWGVFYNRFSETTHESDSSSISLGYSKWNSVSSAKVHENGVYNRLINHLSVYTTGGEVRPMNTAIKIWQRIK